MYPAFFTPSPSYCCAASPRCSRQHRAAIRHTPNIIDQFAKTKPRKNEGLHGKNKNNNAETIYVQVILLLLYTESTHATQQQQQQNTTTAGRCSSIVGLRHPGHCLSFAWLQIQSTYNNSSSSSQTERFPCTHARTHARTRPTTYCAPQART